MASASPQTDLLLPFTPNSHPEVKIPKLIYGTAWKKEQTADLVYEAIKAGFRAFDTAAQPRHYQEGLVGEGIRRAIEEGIVTRKDLHIQTKFITPQGQSLDNMPYRLASPLPEQIEKSLASSLSHFTFSSPSDSSPEGNAEKPYIDTFILHSPLATVDLTRQALTQLATHIPSRIRSLGISNIDLPTLHPLVVSSNLPALPCVVQNRFYSSTGHDVSLRSFCRSHGILYQSFWTLTGNPSLLQSKPVGDLAVKVTERGVVKDEKEGRILALYALVSMGLRGISVLDGTTNMEHMVSDLEGLKAMRGLVAPGGEWETEWKNWVEEFCDLISESP
ncbi:uncharacterized protein BP5553_02839 [Venustampulla echinocandica]|uniref:NADP-dependent oxidoreductase domain-containing protein n=1 Tax=Venustampulla echinocandica TaxID=2656787 RepID=A0A370TSI4_9HELO|nr:uncharacterized protein BP5553_02839 [Venustampulla echinocandica]RDL38499.1 hypothetical protein BP5553_02839 [Venustampulla echinocandica]